MIRRRFLNQSFPVRTGLMSYPAFSEVVTFREFSGDYSIRMKEGENGTQIGYEFKIPVREEESSLIIKTVL